MYVFFFWIYEFVFEKPHVWHDIFCIYVEIHLYEINYFFKRKTETKLLSIQIVSVFSVFNQNMEDNWILIEYYLNFDSSNIIQKPIYWLYLIDVPPVAQCQKINTITHFRKKQCLRYTLNIFAWVLTAIRLDFQQFAETIVDSKEQNARFILLLLL